MHRITRIYLLIIASFVSLVMTSVATRARGKSVNHIFVVLYTFYRPTDLCTCFGLDRVSPGPGNESKSWLLISDYLLASCTTLDSYVVMISYLNRLTGVANSILNNSNIITWWTYRAISILTLSHLRTCYIRRLSLLKVRITIVFLILLIT